MIRWAIAAAAALTLCASGAEARVYGGCPFDPFDVEAHEPSSSTPYRVTNCTTPDAGLPLGAEIWGPLAAISAIGYIFLARRARR